MISFETVIAAIVACVMVVSAISKATHISRFNATLEGTYGLSRSASERIAPAVPFIELTCAVALIAPATRAAGFAATAGLLFATIAVSASAYFQGRRGDCGCFGDLVPLPLGRGTFARQAVLLLLVGFGFAAVAAPMGITRFSAALALALAVVAVSVMGMAIWAAIRALRAIRDQAG